MDLENGHIFDLSIELYNKTDFKLELKIIFGLIFLKLGASINRGECSEYFGNRKF